MSSPVSSITAENFLQYYEQMLIKHRLEKNTLFCYAPMSIIYSLYMTREKQQKKVFFVKLNNSIETCSLN